METTELTTDGSGEHADHGDKKIDIVVNEQPVEMVGRDHTGLEIKQAAIAQHVKIELDFVLSIVTGGGKTQIVGDSDPVKLHEHEHFVAVDDDDNS